MKHGTVNRQQMKLKCLVTMCIISLFTSGFTQISKLFSSCSFFGGCGE